MPRLAWFTPLPPIKSGISQYNWELLPPLAQSHQIDVFVEGSPNRYAVPAGTRVYDAYDFLWRNRQQPYDLAVYQLGNAPCHDYMWAYLVRYPGLVVLHDGQLHHARARMLLQRRIPRLDDYRHEFHFNHPDVHADVPELGAEGLLGSLTYLWPMLRAVVQASRRVVVHNSWLADDIREAHSTALIDIVAMGVPAPQARADARSTVRARHSIPADAVVFTAFGKVTPEKRITQALGALASFSPDAPRAHLLIAGETVDEYDVVNDALRKGVAEKVTVAGYIDDGAIDDYIDASDVCLCMRWPTSRETSASWLRCLAGGKPTISTDLSHSVDIATLDPRNWSVLHAGDEAAPVGVSIDILDEDHSLRVAMRRLAGDAALRTTLGENARTLWRQRFHLDAMVSGYQKAIAEAIAAPVVAKETQIDLPAHLQSTGTGRARRIVNEIAGPEYHLFDAD
jgi:glycosyltransferase involved in cell wall biosynthesis